MKAREEIRALTGLRGVAAAWVVLFHFGAVLYVLVPGVRRVAFVLDRGYLGVDVFFLLSGFVLAHAYGEAFGTWDARAYIGFLRARLARIYPIHLFALLLVALAWLVTTRAGRPFDYAPVGARDLALNLLLVQAWGFSDRSWNVVSWAISVQWLGYLVFPFLWRGIALTRTQFEAWGCFFLALIAISLVYEHGGVRDATFHGGVPRLLLELIAGAFLYRAHALTPVVPRSTGGLIALAGIAFFLAFRRADPLSIPLLAVLVFSLARGGIPARVLSSAPAMFLGRISYSLYMTHHLAIWALARLVPPARYAASPLPVRVGLAVAYLCVVGVVGWATYRVVESPLRTRLRGASQGVSRTAPTREN